MSLHPNVGGIKMDPHQLEQVVLNLAANARDAMPIGGRFRIETSIADAAEPGQGTVFELYFPAVRKGDAETEPSVDRLLKKEATETVLLAEDGPSVRALVRETLSGSDMPYWRPRMDMRR